MLMMLVSLKLEQEGGDALILYILAPEMKRWIKKGIGWFFAIVGGFAGYYIVSESLVPILMPDSLLNVTGKGDLLLHPSFSERIPGLRS